MSTLIDQINERAHDPERAIDEAADAPSTARPKATEAEVREAETRLGFLLPPSLRRLYLEVGNGGFGPGYGIFNLKTLADNFAMRRDPKTGRAWPQRLLPICEWGAGIESTIDCSDPDILVIRHDPNMPKADVGLRVPESKHYAKANTVKEACWIESPSFDTWIQGWAEGKKLFYAAYAKDEELDEDDLDGDDDEDGDES